jgi:hypothetical protein
MPPAVTLVPLLCFKCQTAIPASPDEVAWVCSNCGQGLLLDVERGTSPLEIRFSANIQPGQLGRPFWVAQGQVQAQRSIFGRGDQSSQSEAFWRGGRTFFVPAFACSLDQAIELGTSMLLQPPALQPGSPAAFVPVTNRPEDVRPYAEFIVMGLEASRKDRLKELQFSLQLSEAELWVLP